MVKQSIEPTVNYLSLKSDCPSDKMMNVVQVFVQQARRLNQPLWILSFKFKGQNNKPWYKGIQCLPNMLLQDCYWCEQVIPNDHFIIDLTNCRDTITLQGGLKSVGNPKFMLQ